MSAAEKQKNNCAKYKESKLCWWIYACLYIRGLRTSNFSLRKSNFLIDSKLFSRDSTKFVFFVGTTIFN